MATSEYLVGCDRALHIVFLGESGVGISSLFRLFGGEGTSFVADHVYEPTGEPFRIRFTKSGHTRAVLTAHLFVLCFKVTNENSRKALENKYLPLVEHVGKPYIVLGTHAENQDSLQEGLAFAKQIEAVGYIESSILNQTWKAVKEKLISTAKQFKNFKYFKFSLRFGSFLKFVWKEEI